MIEQTASALSEEFLQDYAALLADAWSSEFELNRLLTDPTGYAASRGLPVADGATVRLDRTAREGLMHTSEVARAWYGTPGEHVLCVPPSTPIDLSEFTDTEADRVATACNNVIIVLPF